MADLDLTPSVCGSPSILTMMRLLESGTRKSVFPKNAFSAWAWKITTGRWACQALVVHALRSTTTAGQNTALKAAQRRMITATWKSGTSCSCRTSAAKEMARGILRSSRSEERRVGKECRERGGEEMGKEE